MSLKHVPSDVARQKIEAAYLTSAKVVSLYGDGYLPLFERMYREHESMKTVLDMRTLALKLSNQTPLGV